MASDKEGFGYPYHHRLQKRQLQSGSFQSKDYLNHQGTNGAKDRENNQVKNDVQRKSHLVFTEVTKSAKNIKNQKFGFFQNFYLFIRFTGSAFRLASKQNLTVIELLFIPGAGKTGPLENFSVQPCRWFFRNSGGRPLTSSTGVAPISGLPRSVGNGDSGRRSKLYRWFRS